MSTTTSTNVTTTTKEETMSFSDYQDLEIFVNNRRVPADPKGEGARQQLGGGLLGHDACQAASDRATARLSGTSAAAADEALARARIARLCGSAPGELEEWERQRANGRGASAGARATATLSIDIPR
jgi:hypothetical protein